MRIFEFDEYFVSDYLYYTDQPLLSKLGSYQFEHNSVDSHQPPSKQPIVEIKFHSKQVS